VEEHQDESAEEDPKPELPSQVVQNLTVEQIVEELTLDERNKRRKKKAAH
jgi:hypothetical protein